MLPSVHLHLCARAILITLLAVSQVECLASCPAVPHLPEQLHWSFRLQSADRAGNLPHYQVAQQRVSWNKRAGDSLESCRVLHLIVGVLDDSVESRHQGLLQVEAAGVAGDLSVWQGLEWKWRAKKVWLWRGCSIREAAISLLQSNFHSGFFPGLRVSARQRNCDNLHNGPDHRGAKQRQTTFWIQTPTNCFPCDSILTLNVLRLWEVARGADENPADTEETLHSVNGI